MMEVSGSRSSGRICCVPGCKSGFYRKNGWQNSLFRFPKDKQMRVKWLNKIKRKDFKITKHSRVCSLHFIADYIVRKREKKDKKSGKITVTNLQNPHLKKNAVPTLFNFKDSKYSKCHTDNNPPSVRKSPSKKYQLLEEREEAVVRDLIISDQIVDFDEFIGGFKDHVVHP